MSRSMLRPGHISRKYKARLLIICEQLAKIGGRGALKLRGLYKKYGKLGARQLSSHLKGLIVRGRFRRQRAALIPRRYDSILRLSLLGIIYQNFSYGLRTRRNEKLRESLRKYYTAHKAALFVKFGEHLRTRSYSGFRLHKDRKKLEKMRKDMAKAAKQALHRRRENSRLMRKAIMETKAAKRRKVGGKIVKKKK